MKTEQHLNKGKHSSTKYDLWVLFSMFIISGQTLKAPDRK